MNVVRLSKIINGGVALKLENYRQSSLVEDAVRHLVVTRRPNKRFPLLLVRGIASDEDEGSVTKELYEHNFAEQFAEGELRKNLRPRFKTLLRRLSTFDWVLKDPEERELYGTWGSHTVREFLLVSRRFVSEAR